MARKSDNDMPTTQVGVQDLIDSLKADGIAEGQRAADTLVTEARQQALRMIEDVREDANKIIAKAREEAKNIVENGKQDLQLASRDATLKLKESFQREFQERFRGLVKHSLQNQQFLQQLILEVARRSVPDDSNAKLRVLLLSEQVSDDQLAKSMADAVPGSLEHFVLGLSADVLRDGITFGVLETKSSGIRVQLVDQDVELDLTDEAVAAVLMRFVSPRFREMLNSLES